MAHLQKNIKHIFPPVFIIKLCVLIIESIKKLFFTEKKNAFYRFIEAILEEYHYCKQMIRKRFNKNLIMSAKEEERFHLTNSCWIYDKIFDVGDNKVRDHCHITG